MDLCGNRERVTGTYVAIEREMANCGNTPTFYTTLMVSHPAKSCSPGKASEARSSPLMVSYLLINDSLTSAKLIIRSLFCTPVLMKISQPISPDAPRAVKNTSVSGVLRSVGRTG